MINLITKSNEFVLALIMGISLWLCACSGQTSQSHLIEGMVIDGVTKNPIEDAQVSVFQDNGKDGLSKDATSVSVLTDIQGAFSFSIKPFKNKTAEDILFSISISTINQFTSGPLVYNYPIVWQEIDPADIIASGDDPYVLNVEGKPYGTIAVFVETDKELITFDDRARYTITGEDVSYQIPITENADFNQEFTYPVKGDSEVILKLEAFISNQEYIVQDTVFCASNIEAFARLKF